ncbi:MAG TPA: hypothetical protein VML75_27465 [Kofleriaceae bacterium]|nr:hypothetical protein [Kofleriaceae bacterium]
MSLETQIAALVAAANSLTASVSGKMGQIDSRVEAAEVAFNAFKATARGEYPAYNVLPNASFSVDSNADGLPDSWAFTTGNFGGSPDGVGAVTLNSSALEPLTNHQAEILALSKGVTATPLSYLSAVRVSVTGHATNRTWARLQATLLQAFAGLYSGGCFMKISNPNAIQEAGVGGGGSYQTAGTKYNLAVGGWQWVSAQRAVGSYFKNHCINFQVKAGMTTDIYIAMPTACDGYLDRPII